MMSVQHTEERNGFFIEEEDTWGEGQDNVDHHRLILQKADALASDNRLKEALDVFSMALRCGSVRPDQLSTLVDCVVRNFKKKLGKDEELSGRRALDVNKDKANEEDVFDCPNCRGFLGEPVTLTCGHSYCKRCVQHNLFSNCQRCGEPIGPGGRRPLEMKTHVILLGLLEKWFPSDAIRFKTICDLEKLLRRKDFHGAISVGTGLIQSDPVDEAVRWLRVEAYTGLRQYRLALEDAELCLSLSHSAEGFYWKAKVLQEMGETDDSLQLFLHCLALNEDFILAKRQVETMLHDLLSLSNENLKVGLRETTHITPPHLRSKVPATDSETDRGESRHPALHQTHNISPHPATDTQDATPGGSENVESSGLIRTHSLRGIGPDRGLAVVTEGLKRVCSAPQLGDQEKGSLLKRKLVAPEGGPHVVYSHRSKHKKQGAVGGPSGPGASVRSHREVPRDLLDPNDLECSLCMRLFYEPVTTPCGHTFCKCCLERCLDHTPQCPLCKESLKEYLAARKYVVTAVLDGVIKQYLSKEHLERHKAHLEEAQELSDLTKNVPVFVCTMAYPTVPCPLHVFEPRYRLMLRRCMEVGTRQFGMCISDPQKGFEDYGCMLIIRSVHFLPDGRSVVDTIGGKRFKVLKRGMRDGYATADIEYLEDARVVDGQELTELQQLHDAVYEQARTWFQNLKNRFRNQILQHFGAMPEREPDIQATADGPACCWWLLAVLPIDPPYQLSVLSMTTLHERLVKIQHILSYLQSSPGE
ncbi:hypothetical protein DPEC_G00187230 [Dallia pectoralis]|uniref:Uncharacterized protein n=1 Tax=Dallia pectoralis TaxID=75939 RepID=A0ACC2GC48_DALPE|nr:hypothetical protein DPEC_G00187230 [Dallia pectoralis]